MRNYKVEAYKIGESSIEMISEITGDTDDTEITGDTEILVNKTPLTTINSGDCKEFINKLKSLVEKYKA